MEDSLEHYIKLFRNTKEGNKATKQTKEVRNEVVVTLQRKQECEARAVKIVEFLIEGKLRPEVFLRCLKHINQSYYQDVVEERAISRLCGYSLCGKQIPEMPKKQYLISTKANKVYDVTDRKNYCSNFCYKASLHIKQQINDGPLWIRKLEESPKFNLLSLTERGLPGEEVDQGIVKPVQDSAFTSVSSFTEISLNEMVDTEAKDNKKKNANKVVRKPEVMKTLHESEESDDKVDVNSIPGSSAAENEIYTQENSLTSDVVSAKPKKSTSEMKTETSENKNSTSEKKTETSEYKKSPVEKKTETSEYQKTTSEKKPETSAYKKSKSKKKTETAEDFLGKIKKYVQEWVTVETYVFLYGEAKVKEMLNETQLEEYFKTLKIEKTNAVQQRKYLEICRKLHFDEVVENQFDRAFVGTKLKPVPDYSKLKEESKVMNLKVRSFYSGVPYESDEKNEKATKATEVNTTADDDVVTPSEVMPLVDTKSQITIRRKVYLNSISRTMANLIPNLGIQSHYVMEDLQLLVKTFKLQADNVVFMPAIRTLIALILLNMLAIRDQTLKAQLESKPAQTFIKIMLGHFTNGQDFIKKLLEDLEDINLFLKHYFSES